MIEFQATGELPEMGAQAFIDAITTLLRSVREIEGEVLPDGDGRLSWQLRKLEEGSATVAVGAAEDRTGRRVETTFIEELENVTRSSTTPTIFSPHTIERLLKTQERSVRENLGAFVIGSRDRPRSVRLDEHSAARLEERLAGLFESIGSVTGFLVNLHTSSPRWYGAVRDEVHGRLVRCYFPHDMLDEFKAAVQRRVTVQGRVRKTSRSVLHDVRTSSIRILPSDDDLPEFRRAFGIGPDTEEVDPVETVRRRRDE